MKTLSTVTDAEDLVYGMAFMGTGGGGSIDHGLELLVNEVAGGSAIGWVDIDDIEPDAWTVCTARLGWITNPAMSGPVIDQAELHYFGLMNDVHGDDGAVPRVNRQAAAVRALSAFTGKKISAVIPLELGAGNGAGSILTAVRLGVPLIDGDYTGRAIPELGNMKVDILGFSPAPICYVDRWGNETITTSVVSAAMADRIGRMLCAASFGRIGFAGYLLTGRDSQRAIVRGTLSHSLDIGRGLRATRGADPTAIADATSSALVFVGRLIATDWDSSKGAFNQSYGTHRLEGTGEYDGRTARIWFKNEHHIVWRDDQPVVTSPDLISVVNLDSGFPVTNDQIAPGMTLAVFGSPTLDPAYRSSDGLKALSPRQLGFDIDYVPVEQTLARLARSGS